MTDWPDVGRALLASWPGLVAAWGAEAIEAYVDELRARGLSPAEALVGLRSWEGDTPPNAGKTFELARRDPNAPTFDDLVEAVWGPGGVLNPRLPEARRRRMRIAACERGCSDGWIVDEGSNSATPCECRGVSRPVTDGDRLERAGEMHPLICGFVHKLGVDRLRGLGLADRDNEFREARRHDLRLAWAEFCQQADRREIAELVGRPPRRALGRPDFAGAISTTTGTGEESSDGNDGSDRA